MDEFNETAALGDAGRFVEELRLNQSKLANGHAVPGWRELRLNESGLNDRTLVCLLASGLLASWHDDRSGHIAAAASSRLVHDGFVALSAGLARQLQPALVASRCVEWTRGQAPLSAMWPRFDRPNFERVPEVLPYAPADLPDRDREAYEGWVFVLRAMVPEWDGSAPMVESRTPIHVFDERARRVGFRLDATVKGWSLWGSPEGPPNRFRVRIEGSLVLAAARRATVYPKSSLGSGAESELRVAVVSLGREGSRVRGPRRTRVYLPGHEHTAVLIERVVLPELAAQGLPGA